MFFLLFENIFNKDIISALFFLFIFYIKVNFVAAKPKNKNKEKKRYISKNTNYIIIFA